MLKDLVVKNRSYRGYDQNRVITRKELEVMVDCARLSPASVNVQPLKYYIAHEKDVVNKIQPHTNWARSLPELNLPYPGQEPTAFIIICQDLTISDAIARYQKDVGIVAQTILLQAVSMGLGGCMIGNYNPDVIKSTLQLSENMMPVLIIALGKPIEEIVIKEVEENESVKYYRDENGVHYVPKRKLSDIII